MPDTGYSDDAVTLTDQRGTLIITVQHHDGRTVPITVSDDDRNRLMRIVNRIIRHATWTP